MNNELFKNKYRILSARASWHDYNYGYYFITICTDKREHFFGEIIDGKMCLSKLGLYANSYIKRINRIYNKTRILSHVVMPNHIHMIIEVGNYLNNKEKENVNKDDVNAEMSDIAKQCGRLSNIIIKYKSAITKFAIKNDIPFLWQSRFYDSIIKDHNEFINIDKYITNNIINWKDDEYYPTIPQ